MTTLLFLAIGFSALVAFVALCAVCMRWPAVLVVLVVLMLAYSAGRHIHSLIFGVVP